MNCLDAGTQSFPLYYYEKRDIQQGSLFDKQDEYIRREAITDFILGRCRESYGPKVTKEDIFYYVYGLLHSPDYRVKVDKDSGIKNDPNDWVTEHDQPRYILDLLLSIVTVSIETTKIVNSLPNISFMENRPTR